MSYVNSVVAQGVRQAQLAAQGSTLRLVEVPTSQLAALWVQSDRLPDPRVREALVRGIDREAIAEATTKVIAFRPRSCRGRDFQVMSRTSPIRIRTIQ